MRHDIVVVGGGLVGASFALALHEAGFDAALVEASRPAAFVARADYDLRVSAIAPASRRWLEELRAWPELGAQRACAYGRMLVWEAEGPDRLEFDAAELGLPELGHIVENSLLLDALWQRLDGVTLHCPARLSALRFDDTSAQLTLDDGHELTCSLVIGADGASSRVRELAGIACYGWSYLQRGIVANVSTERPHAATAWQRFLPTGPLAFLPLAQESKTGGRCSIVWSADTSLAEDLLALDDAAFCERLGAAFEFRLGRITGTTARAAFPLSLQQAERYSLPRLALVGDAAHVIHPLAGQGVNLGFQDAQLLCAELVSAKAARRDPGAPAHLRRYERQRKADNALMAATTDGLYRMFGSEHRLLQFARGRGLGLVNRLAPLKRQLGLRAAGCNGL